MAQYVKIRCAGECDGLAFRIARTWVLKAEGQLSCPVCGGLTEEAEELSEEERKSIHETVDAYVEGSGAVDEINEEISRDNPSRPKRKSSLPPPPPPWTPKRRRAKA